MNLDGHAKKRINLSANNCVNCFAGKIKFVKSQYGCHCNYPLCAAKFVNCEVCIKTVRTAYTFQSEWVELSIPTHKSNLK